MGGGDLGSPPAILLPVLLASALAAAAPSSLTTEAERSGFTRTGRYEEAVGLCRAFAHAYPGRVRYQVLKAPLAPRALEVFRATEAKVHRTNSPSFSRAST